jgi:hypothetical protein
MSALQVIDWTERVPLEPWIDSATGIDGRVTCYLAG